jgi:hypothetical protein
MVLWLCHRGLASAGLSDPISLTNTSYLYYLYRPFLIMMASFMSYFTGRRDPKQTARDAIVSLREQLMMIEKKEEHLHRQIAQDLATAKANAVSNKNGTPSPPPHPPPCAKASSR